MRRTHEALTRSATHPAITDADCRTAVRELSTLSPNQFRQAVDRMHHSGTLGALRDEAPSSVRADFLRLCERNHVVSATQHPAVAAPHDPPAGPRQYNNPPSLPGPLRDMIHARNNEAAHHYRDAYNQYVDRYVGAAHQARTGADLRGLGRPQQPHDISEPGVTQSDRQYLLDRGEVGSHFHSNAGLVAVSERMAELRGVSAPGQVSVRGQVSGRVGASRPTDVPGVRARSEVAGEASGTVTSRGTTSGSVSATPRARLEGAGNDAPSVTVSTNAEGDTTVAADSGNDYGASVTRNRQGEATGGGVDTPLGGAAFDGHRLALTTPEMAGVQGEAGYDARAAQVDMSVSANRSGTVRLPGDVRLHGRVEGQVRVEAQLLTRDAAYDALTGDSMQQRPPEMAAGQSWDSLPQERRDQLTRGLWTEAEWTRGLNQR